MKTPGKLGTLAVFTAKAYFVGHLRVLVLVGLGAFALLLVSSGETDVAEVLGTTLMVVAMAFALTINGGGFAAERKQGVALLYLQHPTTATRVYGLRYVASQIVNLAGMVTLGLLVAVTAVVNGAPFPRVAGILVVSILIGHLVTAITFAFASMGVARDSLATLVLIVATTVVTATRMVQSFQDGTVLPDRQFWFFPFDAFGDILTRPDAGSIAIVLAHVLVWTVLGFGALALWDRSGRAVKP